MVSVDGHPVGSPPAGSATTEEPVARRVERQGFAPDATVIGHQPLPRSNRNDDGQVSHHVVDDLLSDHDNLPRSGARPTRSPRWSRTPVVGRIVVPCRRRSPRADEVENR
jgi:hypothetical protein